MTDSPRPPVAIRIGRRMAWTAAAMAAMFLLYLALGMATGFLSGDIRYWPLFVGIPFAFVLAVVMPFLGITGALLTRGAGRTWLLGAAPAVLAAILWLLVLTAPPAGI